MMSLIQPLTLLTTSNAKWTATQEKTIARDYPFTDIHLETVDQFVVRTYLQFLWLPESIMPISLLVPSLHRVQDASSRSPDTPHPLHSLLEPLLLSLRSVVAKYHIELPQILAQEGGDGEVEESVMWYALGYEMGEVGEGVNSEDAIMLEDRSRNAWLERLERREVQIQILLYFLKLSLPGPCTPLPPVTVPTTDFVSLTKKKRKKERPKIVVPTAQERLESFMDKLSMWQLVINVNDSDKPVNKDERDWMQLFCETIVEPQFKSTLPDMCALLHRKLFPHSPFSDEEKKGEVRSSSGSKAAGSTRPRSNRKLARSTATASTSASSHTKEKHPPKPVQRSSSVLSHTSTSDARSRSRSLSVSLAQDASARRSTSTSGAASSLKRALSREVSMSRGFKPRVQPPQASQSEGSSTRVPAKTKSEVLNKADGRSQGVTLVAATPTKPKARVQSNNARPAGSQNQSRASSFDFEMQGESDDLIGDGLGDAESDELPDIKDEDEELWLPNSSPDILLLGMRKRAASGSSSSLGFSDLTEDDGDNGIDTPVKKRRRV